MRDRRDGGEREGEGEKETEREGGRGKGRKRERKGEGGQRMKGGRGESNLSIHQQDFVKICSICAWGAAVI